MSNIINLEISTELDFNLLLEDLLVCMQSPECTDRV
ncbi:hypothetical protein NOVO_07440 [Rickettsiales bacterium Ac37b]|nr:hypothetical protein NOVO_07440 [Rickettsiales bacterium Ac37b]